VASPIRNPRDGFNCSGPAFRTDVALRCDAPFFAHQLGIDRREDIKTRLSETTFRVA
jgi:hypothetical protein